jgi:hypothetical protein
MQSLFAEILSVLAMTYSDTEPRGSLKYRILSGTKADPGSWGHEYVRHLAAELGSEYTIRQEAATERDAELSPSDVADLRELGKQCSVFFLGHNAEADAVDLLEELECIEVLKELVDKDTYARVCLYMVRYVEGFIEIFRSQPFTLAALTSSLPPTTSPSSKWHTTSISKTPNTRKHSRWLSGCSTPS